jgi:CHAT domain-containing protein/Tfp pilus assembly protein PilF
LALAEGGLRRFATPDSSWHWRFTVLKGEILSRQRLWKESLEVLRPELPPFLSKSDIAVTRRLTQGYSEGFLGNLDESDKYFGEAEELANANQPELVGEVYLRKGTVAFFVRGDSRTSESLFLATLEVARQQKDPFLESNALGSLGLVATRQEHYDEAIDRFEGALKLSRSIGAGIATAKTLGNLGWSYFEMGDYENARSLFRQAERSFADLGLVGDRLYSQINIAVSDFYLRDNSSAEIESRKALDLSRKMEEKEGTIECLNNLSSIAMVRGDVDLAEKYNNETAQLSVKLANRSGELTSTLIAGQIESARQHYQQSERFLNKVIHHPEAGTALTWEAEARLAKVYAGEGLLSNAEREYRHSIKTVEAARSSINAEELRLSFLSSAIDFYDDYIDFLVSQHRVEDALQVAELSRAQTLEEGLSSKASAASSSQERIRPQEIAQKLKAKLLFYWIGHNQSYLWVITPARIAYFTLPKAGEIEPVVKSYQKTVLKIRDAQDAGEAGGKQLYTMLVEPAKKLIPQGSRLIVLPDESLYGLNFETLVVPDPQPHFWIEDVTLTTASSLTLLERSVVGSATKERNLLLVGNTEQPNVDFPPLPQAPAEMQKVGRYFQGPQRKVLEGKQATPSAYLSSNPERFAYLHFVTHGTASRTRPLESAVILSKEGDSYKLYARDIVQHRLNANLVTISACNGSGTRAYSGEGLVGLSWAFLRAGAHNVIGALWEVSDVSTPQLMDSLYGELSQGKDPATALRDAKLKMLDSPDANSVFKKPFYWAPFQLYAGS